MHWNDRFKYDNNMYSVSRNVFKLAQKCHGFRSENLTKIIAFFVSQ